jgi:hypothetical protein
MLQYLPEVIMQEQTGCAHFWAVEVVIRISWLRSAATRS